MLEFLSCFLCKSGICMNMYFLFLFLSENYIVHWGKEGVPKDLEMLNNFRVVFTVSNFNLIFNLFSIVFFGLFFFFY